jgi:hypothetical protein
VEAACTSEMTATLPTTTQYNNPKAELMPIINQPESLKPVGYIMFYNFVLRHGLQLSQLENR